MANPAVINEFMASNDGGQSNNPNGWYPIANQVNGATDDWIEISNQTSDDLSLDGWFLTDEFEDLTQWAFPSGTTIPANGFLIVYASGNGVPDTNGNLHTNFRLSRGGEYIALVDSSFTVISEFASGGTDYPNQDDDISYGLHPSSELPVFFTSPTPGSPNDVAGLARVEDTKFDLGRGYYQTAIAVQITTATEGATIYYTLDGSLPIDASGNPGTSALIYTGAISLTQTTAVRAAAVKEGLEPTNVDCNTYVLLDIDDANADGSDPAGLNIPFLQQTQPAGWGNLSSGDFNMDPDVSRETMTASGQVQGGASRIPNRSPKHSLSFRFREEYGTSKLREPLFPDSSVEEFNVIALRAGYNNSWIHGDSGQRGRGSMIRDQWMRQTMLDMGNPSAGHGFMSHVFINGLYWGVHNLSERADASHYAEYNGGDDDLLDATNGGTFTNGNSIAFNQVDNVINTGDWDAIQEVLNVDQYIDYQLINRYGSNQDLKVDGNWRSAGGGPFPSGMPEAMAAWEVYSWDGERTLEGTNDPLVPLDPLNLRGLLENNADYRIRLADRVQKHFHGNGALTPAQAEARWMRYADDLDRAIIAESARWGDHRRTIPYTRDVEWLSEQNRLYTTYFPTRTATVLNNISLLPSIDAPVFLVGGSTQNEGLIPLGSNLTATGSGTIHYTTDGSDPRLDGGAISPNAITLSSGNAIPVSVGSLVKARARIGSIWSALNEGTFFVGPIADSSNLVISELMYNPAGADENTEFIELLNTDSSNAIDLSLSSFSGIDYTFPLGESLAPGERIVIVTDQAAFANTYNTAGMRIAPGEYEASLSNNGEEIALVNALGIDAQRFTYNDVNPWPVAADGSGYSLTLIAPETHPDLSLPESWRISVDLGGTPGTSDAETFAGAPLEMEFIAMTYRRNLGADDVVYQVEVSSDLMSWSTMGTGQVSASPNGDGTETVTIRSLTPLTQELRQFIRLRVELRL